MIAYDLREIGSAIPVNKNPRRFKSIWSLGGGCDNFETIWSAITQISRWRPVASLSRDVAQGGTRRSHSESLWLVGCSLVARYHNLTSITSIIAPITKANFHIIFPRTIQHLKLVINGCIGLTVGTTQPAAIAVTLSLVSIVRKSNPCLLGYLLDFALKVSMIVVISSNVGCRSDRSALQHLSAFATRESRTFGYGGYVTWW
jgi:hypothetical protein